MLHGFNRKENVMENKPLAFKAIYVLLILFLIASPALAKELIIAFSYDIPPYVMNNGKDGLEPEIIREALKHKGYIVKVKQSSYKRLAIAVSEMGMDAAATVRKTDDGTYYSDNFISFENYAITKKRSGIILNSILDLKGKSIVTWQNACRELGPIFASLFSPDVNKDLSYQKDYHETPVQKDQVRQFWSDRSEVIVIDKAIFIWFTKHMGKETPVVDKIVYHEIFPIPTEFQVNFKSRQIRDDFNKGLKHIRETGSYQQILDKYLK